MTRARITLVVGIVLLALVGCGGEGGGSEDKDTIGGDTTQADTIEADSVQPEGVEADTAQPDSLEADTAQADTTQADTQAETLTQAERYLQSDELAMQAGASLPAANTRFAVKLFQELNASEGAEKNLFVSPFSVSTALAMAYNGASGDTQTAMADALEIAGFDLAGLDSAYKALIGSLQDVDDDVVLAIANSIWMEQSFAPEVQPSFLDAMEHAFGSEIFTEDFGDPETLTKINAWIEAHTGGKIKDMLDQVPADAVMYLINALYYKAAWTFPFDPEDTSDWDFTLADGSTKKVPMMTFGALVSSFAYTVIDDQFCMVRLPYGRDKVAFYGVAPLPYGGDKSVEDYIAGLTAEDLEAAFAGVTYPASEGEGITIAMPRFKMAYKATLNDALRALGMGPAFDLGGFDGIAPGIGISRVIHQAVLEVNEEGTEAAAATIVEMDLGIPPSFTGNRPFFFVIRDDRSGSILFMGKVADPAAE